MILDNDKKNLRYKQIDERYENGIVRKLHYKSIFFILHTHTHTWNTLPDTKSKDYKGGNYPLDKTLIRTNERASEKEKNI